MNGIRSEDGQYTKNIVPARRQAISRMNLLQIKNLYHKSYFRKKRCCKSIPKQFWFTEYKKSPRKISQKQRQNQIQSYQQLKDLPFYQRCCSLDCGGKWMQKKNLKMDPFIQIKPMQSSVLIKIKGIVQQVNSNRLQFPTSTQHISYSPSPSSILTRKQSKNEEDDRSPNRMRTNNYIELQNWNIPSIIGTQTTIRKPNYLKTVDRRFRNDCYRLYGFDQDKIQRQQDLLLQKINSVTPKKNNHSSRSCSIKSPKIKFPTLLQLNKNSKKKNKILTPNTSSSCIKNRNKLIQAYSPASQ